MDRITAMKIIRTLHLGHFPDTDGPLPEDSICRREDVQQALSAALEDVADAANRSDKERNLPPNQGKPWSPDEDAQLAREFDASIAQPELARLHGRTQWAIVKRLERLGKVVLAQADTPKAA
jgi:hypothetical protein